MASCTTTPSLELNSIYSIPTGTDEQKETNEPLQLPPLLEIYCQCCKTTIEFALPDRHHYFFVQREIHKRLAKKSIFLDQPCSLHVRLRSYVFNVTMCKSNDYMSEISTNKFDAIVNHQSYEDNTFLATEDIIELKNEDGCREMERRLRWIERPEDWDMFLEQNKHQPKIKLLFAQRPRTKEGLEKEVEALRELVMDLNLQLSISRGEKNLFWTNPNMTARYHGTKGEEDNYRSYFLGKPKSYQDRYKK